MILLDEWIVKSIPTDSVTRQILDFPKFLTLTCDLGGGMRLCVGLVC